MGVTHLKMSQWHLSFHEPPKNEIHLKKKKKNARVNVVIDIMSEYYIMSNYFTTETFSIGQVKQK